MNEPMNQSLEDLNAELMRKRAAQPKPKEQEPEDYSDILSRLKVIPDEEADRLRMTNPEDPTGPAIRKILKDAGFPERHLDLVTIDRTGKWEETRRYISTRLGKGSLHALIGPRGVGKTQMCVTLAIDVIKGGKKALFATATRFFMELKETYKKDATKTERQVIKDYATPKFLVIDELSKSAETDWENRLLFELLNDRYNAMNDTVVLGNNPTKEDFSVKLGDSLVSRINETGGIIVCNWKSFRQ